MRRRSPPAAGGRSAISGRPGCRGRRVRCGSESRGVRRLDCRQRRCHGRGRQPRRSQSSRVRCRDPCGRYWDPHHRGAHPRFRREFARQRQPAGVADRRRDHDQRQPYPPQQRRRQHDRCRSRGVGQHRSRRRQARCAADADRNADRGRRHAACDHRGVEGADRIADPYRRRQCVDHLAGATCGRAAVQEARRGRAGAARGDREGGA